MATLKATSKLHRRFCERLESERSARGWTKSQAAEALGMKVPSYYALETGQYKPGLDTIEKVCELFDLKITEFFSDAT